MLSVTPKQNPQMRTRRRSTPEQRILAVLKKTKEITARDLSIKAKVGDSEVYQQLKRLEEQDRVMHHYHVGMHNKKFVKYYKIPLEELKK